MKIEPSQDTTIKLSEWEFEMFKVVFDLFLVNMEQMDLTETRKKELKRFLNSGEFAFDNYNARND